MEQNRKPRNKPMHLWSLYDKVGKNIQWRKVYSINGDETKQKTCTSWVDRKIRPIYMLSICSLRPRYTKSKRVGESILCQWKSKESWSRNTHIRQSRL